MPRIEDRLLRAIVYLYKNEDAATNGEPGGSGFLVGEPCAIPEAVFVYAVTNEHVARGCPVVRTAGPPDKRIFPRQWKDWYGRQDQRDDLVVTPIGFAPKDARDFFVDYVPREWFVTPENFTDASMDEEDYPPIAWPFGPGDEVVMLGRFLGYDGMGENRPTVRFGHLAMFPPVPFPHPWGFEQTSFLVECRSVSGYSGSPVFIFRPLSTISAGLLPLGVDQGKRGLPRLLGIDWGNLDRVGHNDYAIDWAEEEAAETFPRRSGMLVAVPAWHLAALLDSEEVRAMKESEEAETRKATEGVNLDFEPSEFDQFEALARKLVAVPKKAIKPDEKERGES